MIFRGAALIQKARPRRESRGRANPTIHGRELLEREDWWRGEPPETFAHGVLWDGSGTAIRR